MVSDARMFIPGLGGLYSVRLFHVRRTRDWCWRGGMHHMSVRVGKFTSL